MLLNNRQHRSPYSDEEIKSFVSSHLGSGRKSRAMAKAIKDLPAEFQVFLLTEGLNTELAGPLEFTQKIVDSGLLTRKFQGVTFAGFCDAQALLNLDERTPSREPDGRIVINTLFSRFTMLPVFSHELGHRLDQRSNKTPGDTRVLLSSRDDWQAAAHQEYITAHIPFLNKDVEIPENLVPAQSSAKLFGKVLFASGLAIAAGVVAGAPMLAPLAGAIFFAPMLKEDKFITTRDHMTQYRGKIAHHRGAEAFAEVTRDYVRHYKKSEGDMAKVEEKMDGMYKKSGLWRLYKKLFLDDFRQEMTSRFPERFSAQSAKAKVPAKPLKR